MWESRSVTNACDGEDGLGHRRDTRWRGSRGVVPQAATPMHPARPLVSWCGDWTTPSDSEGERTRARMRDGGETNAGM